MLPQLRSVVFPLLQDCPSIVFSDTSLTVLQAILTLFYEGTMISSQQIIVEVLGAMKNLGINSDKFTKVGFTMISFKS